MDTLLEAAEDIREQIWKELVRATHDRHHAWRTPVLASTTHEAGVNARTVVLRRVQPSQRLLEIYTDQRSAKVGELLAHPRACLVFWSQRLHWQLRVQADCAIQTDGAEVTSRWQTVRQTKSAGDYMTRLAPGSAVAEADVDDGVTKNSDEHHFAIVQARVIEIDWLELGRSQHRRARWVDDAWQWLTP